MEMPAILSLSSVDLKPTELQRITRDLCISLETVPEISSNILEQEGGSGMKGDVVTVGSIALSLLGSGGVVVTLIGILRSYFDRVPSIEVTLEKDGKKMIIKSNNLQGVEFEQTSHQLRKLLKVME
jgi:hypothetical protein